MQGEPVDFSSIPKGALRELTRQAEACLQGTVQLAIANDQRAVTLTGMFGAAAGVLVALDGTLLLSIPSQPVYSITAVATAALLFFAAAILCVISAKPVDFYVVGYEPRLLAQACTGDDTTHLKRSALKDVQQRIDRNRIALVRAGRWLKFGILTGIAAIPMWALIEAYGHFHLR